MKSIDQNLVLYYYFKLINKFLWISMIYLYNIVGWMRWGWNNRLYKSLITKRSNVDNMIFIAV